MERDSICTLLLNDNVEMGHDLAKLIHVDDFGYIEKECLPGDSNAAAIIGIAFLDLDTYTPPVKVLLPVIARYSDRV